MNSQNGIEILPLIGSRAAQLYRKDGKTFFEARDGSEYAIKVKNSTNTRVKIVVSADGINVIDSAAATGRPNESGYVVNAYDEILIKGYRLNNDEVATFKFSRADKSYATGTKGLEKTNGVIGVRAFKEKIKPVITYEYASLLNYPLTNWTTDSCGGAFHSPFVISNTIGSCATKGVNATNSNATYAATPRRVSTDAHVSVSSVANFPAQTESPSPFSLGSTFGKKEISHVKDVEFEEGDLLTQIEVFYAPRAGLEALGIDFIKSQQVAFPSAFSSSFCAPPDGWTG